MAPIEIGFRNGWIGDHEDFAVDAGKSKSITIKGKTLKVTCDRKDDRGRVLLTDETTRLITPDRGHGIEIPPPQNVNIVGGLEIVDQKSPAQVIVGGELVAVIRLIPSPFGQIRRVGK